MVVTAIRARKTATNNVINEIIFLVPYLSCVFHVADIHEGVHLYNGSYVSNRPVLLFLSQCVPKPPPKAKLITDFVDSYSRERGLF